jgi:hypothetical protein
MTRSQLTLPHNMNMPTHDLQGCNIQSVSFDIFVDFLKPEIEIGSRPLEEPTIMFVPEATVYEQSDFARRKYKVGTAWQTGTTKSISESLRMQRPANKKLRLRVFTSDAGHHPASRGFVYNISHAVV